MAGWRLRLAPAALLGVLVAAGGGSATSLRALETITVSNTNPKAVSSTTVLQKGYRYRITASGTVSDWCTTSSCAPGNPDEVAQPNVGVDALYCYAKWRCGTTPQLWRQLRVNGKGLDELGDAAGTLPYSDGHTYTVTACGTGARLTLASYDAVDLRSSGDNSGAFKVQILLVGRDAACTVDRAVFFPGAKMTLILKNTKFNPDVSVIKSGTVIELCNRDLLYHSPYSLRPKFDLGRIAPGRCKSLPPLNNPGRSPACFRIADNLHSRQLAFVTVLPKGVTRPVVAKGCHFSPAGPPPEIVNAG